MRPILFKFHSLLSLWLLFNNYLFVFILLGEISEGVISSSDLEAKQMNLKVDFLKILLFLMALH